MVIQDKDLQRIYHVLRYCVRIQRTIEPLANGYVDFVAPQYYVRRDACSFYLLQIGELSRTLSDSFKAEHTDIPWKQIRGLRNMVAHNYGHIDFEIVWSIVHDDIPILQGKVHTILTSTIPNFENSFQEDLQQE